MEKTHRVLGLIYLFLIASISVNAEPVALVEDVSADRTDVQFMDFLEADQVIELADGEKLVLGYFLSCKQETITGGTVTINADSSNVVGGLIETTQVECDGNPVLGQISGSEEEAGAAAFRALDDIAPFPQKLIFGLSPVVKLSGVDTLVMLDRLDEEEDSIEVEVTGSFLDFKDEDIKLEPGGIYLLTVGNKNLVFKVSAFSTNTDTSLLQRLLPM
jgi:hypothetical protein